MATVEEAIKQRAYDKKRASKRGPYTGRITPPSPVETMKEAGPRTEEGQQWLKWYKAKFGVTPTASALQDYESQFGATTFSKGSTMYEKGFRTMEDYLRAQRAGADYGPYVGSRVPSGSTVLLDKEGNPYLRWSGRGTPTSIAKGFFERGQFAEPPGGMGDLGTLSWLKGLGVTGVAGGEKYYEPEVSFENYLAQWQEQQQAKESGFLGELTGRPTSELVTGQRYSKFKDIYERAQQIMGMDNRIEYLLDMEEQGNISPEETEALLLQSSKLGSADIFADWRRSLSSREYPSGAGIRVPAGPEQTYRGAQPTKPSPSGWLEPAPYRTPAAAPAATPGGKVEPSGDERTFYGYIVKRLGLPTNGTNWLLNKFADYYYQWYWGARDESFGLWVTRYLRDVGVGEYQGLSPQERGDYSYSTFAPRTRWLNY